MTLTPRDIILSRPRTGRTALFCQALQPRTAGCPLTSRTAHLRPLSSRTAPTGQATAPASRPAVTGQASRTAPIGQATVPASRPAPSRQAAPGQASTAAAEARPVATGQASRTAPSRQAATSQASRPAAAEASQVRASRPKLGRLKGVSR